MGIKAWGAGEGVGELAKGGELASTCKVEQKNYGID